MKAKRSFIQSLAAVSFLSAICLQAANAQYDMTKWFTYYNQGTKFYEQKNYSASQRFFNAAMLQLEGMATNRISVASLPQTQLRALRSVAAQLEQAAAAAPPLTDPAQRALEAKDKVERTKRAYSTYSVLLGPNDSDTQQARRRYEDAMRNAPR